MIYSVAIFVGLFHLSLNGYGWVVMVFGLCYFIASNLAPRAIQRTSARRVFVASMVMQLVAALTFPVALGNLALAILVLGGLFSMAGAFAVVALNILLQDSLPEARGAVLSLSTTTQRRVPPLAVFWADHPGRTVRQCAAAGDQPADPIALVAIWLAWAMRVTLRSRN